jgi:hypothetical protein
MPDLAVEEAYSGAAFTSHSAYRIFLSRKKLVSVQSRELLVGNSLAAGLAMATTANRSRTSSKTLFDVSRC